MLDSKRAEYGEKILATLSRQLIVEYGMSFELSKLRRMLQIAEQFPDAEIMTTLSSQLAWSHFIEILPLKGVRELRRQVSRKAYERRDNENAPKE